MSQPMIPSASSPSTPAGAPPALTLEGALDQLRNGVSLAPSAQFPDAVNARLASAAQTAARQCAKVPPAASRRVLDLLDVAVKAPTQAQGVAWHRRAADALASAFAPHAACRAGCNHCCHIPVKISAVEARALGRAIGRTPVPQAEHGPTAVAGYDSPCPFLASGRCSIYEQRPAVCRSHLNMDEDALLCGLLPSGAQVPVPYVDTRALLAVSVMIAGETLDASDLRQWFPAPAGPAPAALPLRTSTPKDEKHAR